MYVSFSLAYAVGLLYARNNPTIPVFLAASVLVVAIVIISLLVGRAHFPSLQLSVLLFTGILAGDLHWNLRYRWSELDRLRQVDHAASWARAALQTKSLNGFVRAQIVVSQYSTPGFEGFHQSCTIVAIGNGETQLPVVWPAELISTTQLPLAPEQTAIVLGQLAPAFGNRNPGGELSQLRLFQHQLVAKIRVDNPNHVVVLPASHPSAPLLNDLRSKLHQLRQTIATQIADAISAHPSRHAIIHALILGDQTKLTPTQRNAYVRTGVSHLLAFSGLQLSLVAFVLYRWLIWLCAFYVPLGSSLFVQRFAATVAVSVAILYAALTGAEPPAMRACLMIFFFLAGRASLLPIPSLSALALSALLILVFEPADLLHPSFQLSFAGVLALVLDGEFASTKITKLVKSTLAACALTTPIAAYHFGIISLVAIPFNLLAIPFINVLVFPLALIGVALKIAPLALIDHLGDKCLQLSAFAAQLFDLACLNLSKIPYASFIYQPRLALTCAILISVVGLLIPPKSIGRFLSLIGLTSIVVSYWLNGQSIKQHWEITALDVGHGDSIFIRTSQNKTILIDGGGEEYLHAGSTRVLPFLRRKNVSTLDLVIASHGHEDHIGGLIPIFENITVKELWWCGESKTPIEQKVLALARQKNIPIHAPRSTNWSDLYIEHFWPPRIQDQQGIRCGDPSLSHNNNSIVLRFSKNHNSFLATGDIETPVEHFLAQQFGARLQSDILKVPHHGSRTSSSPEFIDLVRPHLAVISAPALSRFRFPHRTTLATLRGHQANLCRTDLHGPCPLIFPRHYNY